MLLLAPQRYHLQVKSAGAGVGYTHVVLCTLSRLTAARAVYLYVLNYLVSLPPDSPGRSIHRLVWCGCLHPRRCWSLSQTHPQPSGGSRPFAIDQSLIQSPLSDLWRETTSIDISCVPIICILTQSIRTRHWVRFESFMMSVSQILVVDKNLSLHEALRSPFLKIQ